MRFNYLRAVQSAFPRLTDKIKYGRKWRTTRFPSIGGASIQHAVGISWIEPNSEHLRSELVNRRRIQNEYLI
jgi:hypothetical protein